MFNWFKKPRQSVYIINDKVIVQGFEEPNVTDITKRVDFDDYKSHLLLTIKQSFRAPTVKGAQ